MRVMASIRLDQYWPSPSGLALKWIGFESSAFVAHFVKKVGFVPATVAIGSVVALAGFTVVAAMLLRIAVSILPSFALFIASFSSFAFHSPNLLHSLHSRHSPELLHSPESFHFSFSSFASFS